MNTCELCELELSAIVDGEGDVDALPTILDHVLECPRCRDFYRGTRAVDAAVARSHATPPPERVWRRIEAEAGRGTALAFDTRRAAAWVARAAAVSLVAVGLWAVGALRLPQPPIGDAVEVVLEGRRGAMSDERFVRLTTELLQSDRKYHRKMMEILAVVNGHTLVEEGDEAGQAESVERAVLESGSHPGRSGDDARSRPAERRTYW